jgi:hypothetical protein
MNGPRRRRVYGFQSPSGICRISHNAAFERCVSRLDGRQRKI